MIELKNVTKTYVMGDTTVHALKGVNLTIEAGEFVAIMGPSGSGKSTLAHILGLLDVPGEGSYTLRGKEVSKLQEDELATLRSQEIGFIFQQFNLLPRMSAAENVALPLLYKSASPDGVRALPLLEKVGLASRSHHHPNELSGGQQQRVAIARALMNQPRILLADEPTGNLDSSSEKEIMGILSELNAQGITVIIITHEDEIGEKANRLIRMRDGMIQSDTRKQTSTSTHKNALGSTVDARDTKTSSVFLKEVSEHFKQGFRVLASNKVRTGLSMLGILIGVAAVVALLALGRGAQKEIEERFSSLGSNLLVLRTGAKRVSGAFQEGTTRLTVEDAQAIRAKTSGVINVGATINGRAQVAFESKNWNTQINGVEPIYAVMHDLEPKVGRFFTSDENRSRARFAVIGATVAKELFGDRNPMGEIIKVNRESFQIIGLLPKKGGTGWRDQDDVVVIPLFTAMYRVLGKNYVEAIEVQLDHSDSIEPAQAEILQLLYERKHIPEANKEQAFNIMNMAEIQEALSESSKTMSMLLAAIAAISLLVGGIGIMNIMIVSVTERTKEIGLRKAIGAKRRDILLQFLAEAVVVSAIGGLAGVALAWAITASVAAASGLPASISIQSVVGSVVFSAMIGIIFGIYPASKASKLHPIAALRYE